MTVQLWMNGQKAPSWREHGDMTYIDQMKNSIARPSVIDANGKFHHWDTIQWTADGWPLEVPAGGRVEFRALWHPAGLPEPYSGKFHVIPDGVGKYSLFDSTQGWLVRDQTGPSSFVLGGRASRVQVKIEATDQAHPLKPAIVHDRHLMDRTLGETFTPEHITFWRGLGVTGHRAMNESEINKLTPWPAGLWKDRPKATHRSYNGGQTGGGWKYPHIGMPLEVQIEFCNLLNIDPWINVPVNASDDWVQGMAALAASRLNSNLTCRVEYGNELWNNGPGFEGCDYCIMQAKAHLGGDGAYNTWSDWAVHRAAQISAMFRPYFADTNGPQMEMVLAGGAGRWPGTQRLFSKALDYATLFDAFAIGIYGGGVSSRNVPITATAAEFKAAILQDLQGRFDIVRQQMALAKSKGVKKFYGYEGGQHIYAAINGKMTQVEKDARDARALSLQNDPFMAQFYAAWFTGLEREGVDGVAHYASYGGWGSKGSWGLSEYLGQEREPGPHYKLRAIQAYAGGQPLPSPIPPTDPDDTNVNIPAVPAPVDPVDSGGVGAPTDLDPTTSPPDSGSNSGGGGQPAPQPPSPPAPPTAPGAMTKVFDAANDRVTYTDESGKVAVDITFNVRSI